MLKILIADDHIIVRKGLKQILQETSDIVVSGEASNDHEVFDKVMKEKYDVVLLDISMPGRSGLDILQELHNENPDLPVLVLSMHPEERYAIRVLKAGASGYLTKNCPPDELITAIRKVSNGGKYITSSLSEKLAANLSSDTDKPLHETLSTREYQVMQMIASGKTANEIADELSLSVKTINTYRSHIREKLNLKNNVEITHYAIKQGLID